MDNWRVSTVPVALAGLIERVEGHAGGDVVVDLVGLIPLRLVVGPLEGRVQVRVRRALEHEDQAWETLAAEEDGGSAELGAEPVETQIRIGLAQLRLFPRLSQLERTIAFAIAMVAGQERRTLDEVVPAQLAAWSGTTERGAARVLDALVARQRFVDGLGLARRRSAGLCPAGVEDARARLRLHIITGRWAPYVLLPATEVLAARYGLEPEAVAGLLDELAVADHVAFTEEGGVRRLDVRDLGNASSEARLAATWMTVTAPELGERVTGIAARGGQALAFSLEGLAAPVTVAVHDLGLTRGVAIWADAGRPDTQRLAFHAELCADLGSLPTLTAMLEAVAAVAGG